METQEQPQSVKQPRSIRLATLFAIVLAIILVMGGARLLTWAYQSSEVLVVNNSPVPVQPPEVKDGGKVFLTIDFCKNSDTTGTTEVSLIGQKGAKISVSWPQDTSRKQCSIYPEVPVSIPGQTPTDIYYAEFITCYKVNPLKPNQCSTFKSQEFKVINAKLNPGDAQV